MLLQTELAGLASSRSGYWHLGCPLFQLVIIILARCVPTFSIETEGLDIQIYVEAEVVQSDVIKDRLKLTTKQTNRAGDFFDKKRYQAETTSPLQAFLLEGRKYTLHLQVGAVLGSTSSSSDPTLQTLAFALRPRIGLSEGTAQALSVWMWLQMKQTRLRRQMKSKVMVALYWRLSQKDLLKLPNRWLGILGNHGELE